MKVKQTSSGFSGLVESGRYVLFLELDIHGADLLIEQLMLTCVSYNRVVIRGDEETLLQNDDIVKLIKKVKKKNNNVKFVIHTNGTKKPKGFTSFGNVKFIVDVQLKNSGKDLKNRIFGELLNWFNECDSNFLFTIKSDDDFDETNLIVNDYGLKRGNIFLTPLSMENNNFELVKEKALVAGYNLTLPFDKILWE